MFIFVGVQIRESDIKYNETRNIYNYTETKLSVWNSSNFQSEKINLSNNITMEDSYILRGKNIINKLVDVMGYSFVQIMKVSIEFGYEKVSTFERESFLSLGKLIFIIIIISIILPALVPALAIIYLLFEGLKWLINQWRVRKWRK